MKNKIFKITLILLLLPMLILSVKAETVDPTRTGSILGLYKSGDKLLTDTNISIYKIADVDTGSNLSYTSEFAAANYPLNNLTSSQQIELMNNIDQYIISKNIQPTKSAKTDSEGKISFTDLATGLYYVKSDIYTEDDYTYQSKNLIGVPNLNQNTNSYMYDIQMVPKIDIKPVVKPDDSNNGNGSNGNNNGSKTNTPNTYDNIYKYFGVFFITIIGIMLIVYYISKNKRSEENEKNN